MEPIEIPCKNCIIQVACRNPCPDLFRVGVLADKGKRDNTGYDEYIHYEKQYKRYLKYQRRIFNRKYPNTATFSNLPFPNPHPHQLRRCYSERLKMHDK